MSSVTVNWALTDGVLENKTFISLINMETHGASLSSCAHSAVVIIVWPDKKRGAIIERPHSHCAIVLALLVVICRALHLIAIRQTADAKRLKREICCLVWAYGCLSGQAEQPYKYRVCPQHWSQKQSGRRRATCCRVAKLSSKLFPPLYVHLLPLGQNGNNVLVSHFLTTWLLPYYANHATQQSLCLWETA